MFFLRRVNLIPLFTALISLLVAAPAAHAKETPAQIAARRALTALYVKGDRDSVKKDVPALMAVIAPDFQFFTRSGPTLNRAQYEALTIQVFKDISNISSATRIKKIEWRGPDAIVYTSSASKWIQKGAPVQTSGTSREYWSPSSGKWLLRQVAELSSTTTVNGTEVTTR